MSKRLPRNTNGKFAGKQPAVSAPINVTIHDPVERRMRAIMAIAQCNLELARAMVMVQVNIEDCTIQGEHCGISVDTSPEK